MILYHYTDQSGFIGIFTNQELWATKIQYLNDDTEYRIALNLAEKVLQKRINEHASESVKSRLKFYLSLIPSIKNMHICVCSLTEEGDLLSQWRGYSNSLGGYSIGFDKSVLISSINMEEFELVKCVYDGSEQLNVVTKMIDDMIDKFITEPEPEYHTPVHYESGSEFQDRLAKLAPKIKDASFKEEKEWRIISKVKFSDLEFRSGKSMLTPFAKLSFGTSKNRHSSSLVDEIIVGHTPHPDLAVNSTESFLTKHMLPGQRDSYDCPIKVRKSTIPFRNW
jgi:hypothetical protein